MSTAPSSPAAHRAAADLSHAASAGRGECRCHRGLRPSSCPVHGTAPVSYKDSKEQCVAAHCMYCDVWMDLNTAEHFDCGVCESFFSCIRCWVDPEIRTQESSIQRRAGILAKAKRRGDPKKPDIWKHDFTDATHAFFGRHDTSYRHWNAAEDRKALQDGNGELEATAEIAPSDNSQAEKLGGGSSESDSDDGSMADSDDDALVESPKRVLDTRKRTNAPKADADGACKAQQAADDAKKLAEEQAAAEARRLANEASAREAARKAADVKKAADAKATTEARAAAEAKAAQEAAAAKRAQQEREAQVAAEAKRRQDELDAAAKRAAEEQAAAAARQQREREAAEAQRVRDEKEAQLKLDREREIEAARIEGGRAVLAQVVELQRQQKELMFFCHQVWDETKAAQQRERHSRQRLSVLRKIESHRQSAQQATLKGWLEGRSPGPKRKARSSTEETYGSPKRTQMHDPRTCADGSEAHISARRSQVSARM